MQGNPGQGNRRHGPGRAQGRVQGRRGAGAALALCATLLAAPAGAQSGLAPGWTLQPEASSLRFQSVKNETVVESSGFAAFAGGIDAAGMAQVRVMLDSVDTGIDLRNVRMRFLFFESFRYPEAVISARIDPQALADLPERRRMTLDLPYTLDLHGVSRALSAEVVVTQISDALVAVSTNAPIAIHAADFNLAEGVRKLEEAAGVRIIPSATVSFDFVFARDGGALPAPAPPPPQPAAAALEVSGNFDSEACLGRFEILSRTGNIFFGVGSARIDPRSRPLLDTLGDVVARCPGMTLEVAGHTDSDGSARANQRLSERRAEAVAAYLRGLGIDGRRLVAVGHGEDHPVVPNDSPENKARNRRIEFRVQDG